MTKFVLLRNDGASKYAPYRPAPNPTTVKPFGIGFGDLCGHAKPWFDGLLPFP
jgi:hypothetical protein